MTQLLLIAHTPLAQAFKTCAMHTYPECSADVLALDVLPEWDAAKVEAMGATATGGALLGKGHLAMTIDQGPDMNRYQGLVALDGTE